MNEKLNDDDQGQWYNEMSQTFQVSNQNKRNEKKKMLICVINYHATAKSILKENAEIQVVM